MKYSSILSSAQAQRCLSRCTSATFGEIKCRSSESGLLLLHLRSACSLIFGGNKPPNQSISSPSAVSLDNCVGALNRTLEYDFNIKLTRTELEALCDVQWKNVIKPMLPR